MHADILKKDLMGKDGVEDFLDPLAVLSVSPGYTDSKKTRSPMFMNMDRCDSHT